MNVGLFAQMVILPEWHIGVCGLRAQGDLKHASEV